jgi:WD40 repeat protein
LNSAGFSPDGTRIVTASWDKTATLWDVRLQMMLAKDLLAEVYAWPLTIVQSDSSLASIPAWMTHEGAGVAENNR